MLQMTQDEDERFQANYEVECENCSQTPTVNDIGLCGACCFGEADCIDPNNW
jgi:hypothetical protein